MINLNTLNNSNASKLYITRHVMEDIRNYKLKIKIKKIFIAIFHEIAYILYEIENITKHHQYKWND